MPYDEYEISLGRELAVCEQYVRKYEGLAAAGAEQAAESLRRWSEARDEYARLLREVRAMR